MAYLGRSTGKAGLTSADIPDNSITAAKIVEGTITVGDIGTDAVGTDEIVNDAVTGGKLANDIAISTSGNIATTGSGTITSAGHATFGGKITMGSGSYMTGEPSAGIRLNSSDDSINLLICENAGDVKVATGDLIFLVAGKGIVLGATTNVDANTLDDYEEGTGTPVVRKGGTVCSLASTNGYHYTKIGNKVFFNVEFNISSYNGGTGVVSVDLPFTASGGNYTTGTLRIYYGNVTGNEFATIHSGNDKMFFHQNVHGSANINMDVSTGSYVFTSLHYETTA